MIKRDPRDYATTAVLFVVALAVRWWFMRVVALAPAWDGVLYERGAQAIARGLGYSTFMFEHRSSDTVATAYYPVGYSAFVGAFYAIFGAHVQVLRVCGVCVSSLTVAIAHRLAWRVSPGNPARIASFALALIPGQILFASSAMTEPLFGLLITLAVYLYARRPDRPTKRDVLIATIVLAVATYVRPQAVLVAPLLMLVRESPFAPTFRARILTAIGATALVLFCVLPWSIRNCARLDGCAFVSTNGGSNLAIGAVPRANGQFFFLDGSDGCRGVVGEVARDRCWRAVAWASVRAHPWRWIKLAFAKVDHTLSYESFPVGYLRESERLSHRTSESVIGFGPFRVAPPVTDSVERSWRRAITWPWRVLVAFALLSAIPWTMRRRFGSVERCAWMAILAVLLPHVVFFGGDRYHVPIVALVAVLASSAFRDVVLIPRRWKKYTLFSPEIRHSFNVSESST